MGTPVWPEKKVLGTSESYQLRELEYIADGKGGIVITWQLFKEAPYGGLFAQRIDAEGNPVWGEKGIPVFNPDRYQGNATILNDGSGGALFIAIAGRNSLGGDMVYAQHLDAGGNRLWGDGIRVDQ